MGLGLRVRGLNLLDYVLKTRTDVRRDIVGIKNPKRSFEEADGILQVRTTGFTVRRRSAHFHSRARAVAEE